MAFVRPTLPELVDRIEQDFVSRLTAAGSVLRRSVVLVLSRVLAGAAHMLHGHLSWVARQIFIQDADADYVARWGSIFGVSRNPPVFATGSVTITGTNATVVPAGTVLVRSDAAEYTTNADVTIALGTATANVTASVADKNSNCAVGTLLTFAAPVAGADANVTVVTLDGGTDEEDAEAYRARILERTRAAPHGGNAADYIAWAKEVSGVTRAWVYPRELGAGTVVVRFMRDDDSGSPIPSGGEVTTVQTHLDAVAPVTATVTVAAPTAAPLAYTIHLVPDTTATRAAVTAELTDFHQRTTEPGVTVFLSQIRTTIGTAEGVSDYTLTVPAADVTHVTGEISTLGTITWV